jgi:hypothetical protein
MRPLLAAAVVALLPAAAHAQLETPAPAPAVPSPVAPARRSQFLVSVRFALGASVALGLQSGSSFAYGLTLGGRVIVPSRFERAWIFGSDLGVDRTAGFVDRGATHVVLGPTAAYSWGTFGLAWAPRALVAVTDSGDVAFGVRNGLRLLLVAGVLDVELAHQYLAGPAVVNHQVFLTLGLDPGLVVSALTQHRGRW